MLRLGIAGIGAIAGDYIGLIVGGKVRCRRRPVLS